MDAKRSRLWVLCAIAAAGLVMAGSVLPWLEPSVDGISSADISFQTPTFAGTDVLLGRITLAAGLIGLIAAFAGRFASRFGAVLVLLTGLVGIGVVAWLLVDTSGAYVSAAASELANGDVSSAAVRSSLELPLSRELIAIETQLGVWILLAGSALAIIVGAGKLTFGRRGATHEEAAAPVPDRFMGGATDTARAAREGSVDDASNRSSDEPAMSAADGPSESHVEDGSSDPHGERRSGVLGDSWVG